MLIEKQGLKVLCPVDDNEILQITSTKEGGYSTGEFASFNAALHVGDDCYKVLKNLEKLKSVWGIDRLVTLTQVHGAEVHEVTRENMADVMFKEGDGLFTRERGLALGILTADCWNIHLIGDQCIASLHCGWKSTAAGIVNAAFEMFEKYGDRVKRAVVGPGISGANYEVGSDLAEIFGGLGFSEAVSEIGGRKCLSLEKVLTKTLRDAGVSDIISVPYCTFGSELFYSYRRDNGKTGRMISVLVRKK